MKEFLEQERQNAIAMENMEKSKKIYAVKSDMAQKQKIVETKLASIPQEYIESAYPLAKSRPFNKEELKEAWARLNDNSASAFMKRVLRGCGHTKKSEMTLDYAVQALFLKFYLDEQLARRIACLEKEYETRIAEIENSFLNKINELEETKTIEEEPIAEIVEEETAEPEIEVEVIETIEEEPIAETVEEETVEPEIEVEVIETVEEEPVEEIVEEEMVEPEIEVEVIETVEEKPIAETVEEEAAEPEIEVEVIETVEAEPIAEIVEEETAEPEIEIEVIETVEEEEPIAEIVEEETAEPEIEIEVIETVEEEPVEETVSFASYTQYNGVTADDQNATNGIVLPLFLNDDGAPTELVLGTTEHAHLFVASENENVKNAFLHTAITSIASSYHPDDAEIWLLDYEKNALKIYLTERTKHVRLIALENSLDFTESFLMFLHRFFAKREQLMRYANASDIREYREKCGRYKMPRVVLIANEIAHMTRYFGDNIVLRGYLETALAEYTKYGLSCIFCSSSSAAIDSLTDTGRECLTDRLTTKNDLTEMQNALELSEDTLTDKMIETSLPHTVWYSFKSREPKELHLLAVSEDERIQMTEIVNTVYDTVKEDAFCLTMNGLTRRTISDTELKTHIVNTYNDKAALNLCLGDPVQISLAFHTYLWRKSNQNILLTGRNAENTFDVLASVLRSACLTDYRTVILADAENPFAKLLHEHFQAIDPQKKLVILENKADIKEFTDKMQDMLAEENAEAKVFVVWLGAQSYGLEADKLWTGGRSGVLNLLAVQSFEEFSEIEGIDLSYFDHKISTEIEKDVLLSFGYPYTQTEALLFDNVNAVYYSGSKMMIFKPYCLEERS